MYNIYWSCKVAINLNDTLASYEIDIKQILIQMHYLQFSMRIID